MDQEAINSFRLKLDQHYRWPSLYMFKFIVPKNRVDEVILLFPKHTSTQKESRQGNYVSITLQMMMPSSEAVIAVYQKASTIQGLIAL
jgi:putative lipoic acid-binding regulatory protein